MKPIKTSTAPALVLALAPASGMAAVEWQSDNLYADGMSVDFILDEVEVYGSDGDEIGSVENIVFSEEGHILSVVAEVGGFWDMFDTHVNVPWEEVEFAEGRMTIPVTEESVEDYSVFKAGYLTAEGAQSDIAAVEEGDLATGPRTFRASGLIGDYARTRDETEDSFANYGYVNDLIIRDGQLAAVVVSPRAHIPIAATAGPQARPTTTCRMGNRTSRKQSSSITTGSKTDLWPGIPEPASPDGLRVQ